MKVENEKIEKLEDLRFKTICFMIFLGLIVILSIFIIKSSIIQQDDKISPLFDYNIGNTINYKVHLNPNNFFDAPFLGMDRQYPTDLIKTIEVDFGSNLKISKNAVIEYDYEITGVITGTYSSDNSRKETNLWEKDFLLQESTSGKINKKSYVVKENLELDFPYYNQIVSDFKRELRLNIDGKFSVKMVVNYKFKVGNEIVTHSDESTLEFPLNKAAFVITTKVPQRTIDTVNATFAGDLIVNTPLIFFAIIFLIITIVLFIKYILTLIQINKKTEYAAALEKMLKNFGDIIVESKTPIDSSKYEILEINDFEDMVDVENEVRVPIIYYEKTKELEGWFTLVHGNIMYRYVLYGKPGNKRHKHSKSV